MKSSWKTYLLYASLIVIGGGFIYLINETIQAKNTGFETKTLWDWMELLIIPLVLAIGAFFLQRSERAVEREIAKDRQQEAALQAYIKQMSELLLNKKLRTTKQKEVRDVARTLTISVMQVLDRNRNNLVIQFLREAQLITDKNSILNGANMERMNLQGLNLFKVVLHYANLEKADMRTANLALSDLSESSLSGANLQKANLHGANLEKVDMSNAILKKANLYHANLEDALVTNKQLATARGAPGYAMVDGTKKW